MRPLFSLRARIATCLVAATAACSSPSDPPAVSVVRLDPLTATVLVGPSGGGTVQLTATPETSSGRLVSGKTIVWGSSAPSIALVSGAGVVTALAPGSATITATVDAIVGSAVITVLPVPVAAIDVSPTSLELGVGVTRTITATVRDSTGAALSGRPITWTSAAPTIAEVSSTGVVRGLAVGATSIQVSAGGRSTTIPVTVLPPPGPSISAVTPAILVPGALATISGDAFAPTVAGNSIRVAGRTVVAQSASPTALSFLVPCVNTGTVAIDVTTADGTGPAITVPLSAPLRTLQPGEALILTGADESRCNELAATGPGTRYLVSVSNISTALNTLVDFELAGNTPIAGTPAPRLTTPSLRARLEMPTQSQAFDVAHAAQRSREAALYESLRSEGAFAERPATRRAAQVVPPALGALRTFYYNFNSCSDSSNTITARLIYRGTFALVWEDTTNTLQSTLSSSLAGFYQRLGEIYDTDQHAAVRDHFGDPLLRDPLTDGDGRLGMVFTQRLNGSGAAAYVTSCDQVPRNTTNRAASNFGEYFYSTVPTVEGNNVNSTASPDGWFYFIARTVVHEVKHIASLAARAAKSAPSEASWLEEGTARHAEEVWARAALHRVPWKGNTGYGTSATNGIFCDFNPSNPTCLAADPLRRPSYGMRRQFNEIRPKLLEPWSWSPYGDGTGQSGSVFYNTAWSLVRYAIDRYGQSDAAFLTALTQATTTGMTNLSAVAGVPPERLIGGWGLALIADDYPNLPTLSPDARIDTWNLRSIYAGLNGDPAWSTRFNTPFPITPVSANYGPFLAVRPGLRAGSHAFFELSGGTASPQLLELRGPSGAAASPLLRLAVVRVQ
jgi:hypothetical protein